MNINWVDAKDKLPEFEEPVLLYWNGVICIGTCEKFENTYRFNDGHQDDIYNYVTHWATLPEEPKNYEHNEKAL